MSYELEFLESALKEWKKLDANTREQFRKKLEERCENPHVPSAKLRGAKDRYKIKLRSSGYRLVYEVIDGELVVLVIAVGRRDRSAIYEIASKR
ncbi:type II toxin-antitoxin system RelE family toxin [Pseudaminobacter soli (ex Li et al. 2025)]|uniref:Type II toxin-antitoxin system mRNA interferase toxin, RelE/StbE family n=1 Tax=Pseudaminobacter soli (ex Li et al. 2025) TaxID=1295366 RepID=A0A2P7S0E2_9HYPH|nr:type II toxin-antitoxin system RelE/ParE family toxin [Mesorhizobium soli]PSJ55934.1 type II toxin-antitoxin system mRNA interferase toxin, RelE/StbE family [Mesorhizobium soli]